MADYSYVFNAHPEFIESLYKKYQDDPNQVEDGWRAFFKGFDFSANGKSVLQSETENPLGTLTTDIEKEFAVLSMIHGYRDRGHLLSDTNPIRKRKDRKPHINLEDYGLTQEDLNKEFVASAEIGGKVQSLSELITQLNNIYVGKIGFEFAHIEDREKRMWLRSKIEQRNLSNDFGLTIQKKNRIAQKLNGATIFEKFLHTKYIGQKRFSLEGGEMTIPALDALINSGVDLGVKEVVIGMAHRGRLNVLVNILGKTYEEVFSEFEGNVLPDQAFGDGDVKYHLGFSSQQETITGKKVQLKLMPNPSHLEAVDPVVLGYSRAMADIGYEHEYDSILPILIHGDAAIAGQGIIYEIAQMSNLPGYYTGGTVHFVINNQIGFTTDFDEARSSTYCTPAAQMIQAPVFHVNGDDAEAVVFAAELAMEYRQKFNNDVYIDMVCYRKHGHNEGDDPRFTQPKMYEIIKSHKNPREIYLAELEQRGIVEKDLAKKMEQSFWSNLQERLDYIKQNPLPYLPQEVEKAWQALKMTKNSEDFEYSPKTGIALDTVNQILHKLTELPEGFEPVPKVNRLFSGMQKNIENDALDWGLAEMLAYGSILLEGKNVRMSGQDVKRGTFSHRHAIVHDKNTFEEFNRLSKLNSNQGKFMIYNSLLSEFGVLGFEYGYSLAYPDALVLWEAQFGDFSNGAQVMMDQFISAAESKWNRMSGIVMLLPHGYEGQGPEHSSARLERYLQLCADYNMTVANCTTPANFFHLLRRQLERPFRKPLVVMSPKLLLRHPLCVSKKEEFVGDTRFQELLDDHSTISPEEVKKIVFCTGKIYYDLLERKQKDGRDDIALIRLEQIYPFPETKFKQVIEKYKNAKRLWVQEEPGNMGAWQYILSFTKDYNLDVVARKTASSPATGYKNIHEKEQQQLLDITFS